MTNRFTGRTAHAQDKLSIRTVWPKYAQLVCFLKTGFTAEGIMSLRIGLDNRYLSHLRDKETINTIVSHPSNYVHIRRFEQRY